MTITIHQPEYLPWLGFFDRIQNSDIFIILDDVGYQKNGFINRNRIKTKDGAKWLTIPVKDRSPNKKINEVVIDNNQNWKDSQLSLIKINYSSAPYFKEYYNFLENTFSRKWDKVADLDFYLIENIIKFLNINTKVVKTSDLKIKGEKTERIINICKRFGADTYLSGPGGKNYMDLSFFKKEGLKVIFQEFAQAEYKQQFMDKGFLPHMSIIDLLFNCGPKSSDILI